MKRYQSYKNAETAVYELILRAEDRWLKLEIQLEFLHSIWSTIDERFQSHQDQVLQVLQNKLLAATASFEKVLRTEAKFKDDGRRSTVKKAKFAVLMRDHLVSTVEDLERWHSTFDPSWYLITRIGNISIDRQLDGKPSGETQSLANLKGLREAVANASQANGQGISVFLPENIILPGRAPIPHSSSFSGQTRHSPDMVLVDRMYCAVEGPSRMVKDVRHLAKVLSHVDPFTFGLLTCQGVIKIEDAESTITGFDFVFRVPTDFQHPRSLRDIFLEAGTDKPLDERFSLAALLARSIFFIHTSGFVHKNIRPETVIIFKCGTIQQEKPILVGFERSRHETTSTSRFGDDVWERNLYRAPERQGIVPEEDFIMQHDIYSLGVVLLEIGLNISFIQPGNVGQHGGIVGARKGHPVPHAQLEASDILELTNVRKKANWIKRRLVTVAEAKLPSAMGPKYTQVVVSCLTCLDKDNNGFGDDREFFDEDGILVGVRFIEAVRGRLLNAA